MQRRGRPGNLSGREGLSLIEVVIGVALLGIVLSALVMALSTGALVVGKVGQRGTVQDIARAQLEYVKAQPYAAAPTTYPTITPQEPYTITAVASPLGASDQGIQMVTVTVYWEGNSLMALEAYKVDR